jgi:transcriptional regulator with XRE-family HTH domain
MMATRPTPARTRQAARELGEQLRTWRKLQGLTAQQLAERAGVNRNTVGRLERGEGSTDLHVFLNVVRALGQQDALLKALDPYETDLGRARADEALPQRVRR